MKLKTSLLVSLSFLIFAVSCTKDDSGSGGGGTTTVAAKTMLNEPYGTDPLQKMDIYLPANRSVTSTKVLILIHGGGWTQGDKIDFNVSIDTLKKGSLIMPYSTLITALLLLG